MALEFARSDSYVFRQRSVPTVATIPVVDSLEMWRRALEQACVQYTEPEMSFEFSHYLLERRCITVLEMEALLPRASRTLFCAPSAGRPSSVADSGGSDGALDTRKGH